MIVKCPKCNGNGTADGTPVLYGIITHAGHENCSLCKGMGAIFIRPATKEESAAAIGIAHLLNVHFGGE